MDEDDTPHLLNPAEGGRSTAVYGTPTPHAQVPPTGWAPAATHQPSCCAPHPRPGSGGAEPVAPVPAADQGEAKIGKLEASEETYTAKVTVLIENVRHHVKEEEQDWFPRVRQGMGRNALQELGEQMETAEADAPAQPSPTDLTRCDHEAILRALPECLRTRA